MADDNNIIAGVKPYYGTEIPIPPKGAVEEKKRIVFNLEPEEEVDSYEPEISEYMNIPEYAPREANSVVIDIETTGSKPWKSKIFCIGMKPVGDPSLPVISIVNDDEQKLLTDFIELFESNGFDEIIGYNVIFDVRFLFTHIMRYRLKWPSLSNVELYDVMQTMKQVFHEYVPGNNVPGKLEEWSEYLFGAKKPYKISQIFDAYDKKDWDLIKEYNKFDVEMTYLFYILINNTI